ncbi:hypothetical protein ACFFOM_11425 [Microlunatus capsulatus]|uniref:Lysylphosphatidylglycerol synthetase-like protein (DUF2156 family) n=1 Tax=Microlunatus capsulatus TaxID=99117 RepID=A0ABS4ZA38_9ACTN|nr:hypothetical protein [Microlunatus capsulatus]MBP2417645.1 lysylphosphatidylglycerol synthetase-like protein (DUF2156 family) [Microlunatus capsulatus]
MTVRTTRRALRPRPPAVRAALGVAGLGLVLVLVGVVLPVWTAIGAADGAVAGAVDVPAGRIAAVTVLGLLVVLALAVGLVLTRRAALAWPLALAALALALVVAVYPLLATAARAVQQGREFIPWVSDLVVRFTG